MAADDNFKQQIANKAMLGAWKLAEECPQLASEMSRYQEDDFTEALKLGMEAIRQKDFLFRN